MSTDKGQVYIHCLACLKDKRGAIFLLSIHFFHIIIKLTISVFKRTESFTSESGRPIVRSCVFTPIGGGRMLAEVGVSIVRVIAVRGGAFRL